MVIISNKRHTEVRAVAFLPCSKRSNHVDDCVPKIFTQCTFIHCVEKGWLVDKSQATESRYSVKESIGQSM